MDITQITEIAEKIEQAERAGAAANFEHAEKTKSDIATEDRANVLIQALPYIQKWAGKTIVVKYGGNPTPKCSCATLTEFRMQRSA